MEKLTVVMQFSRAVIDFENESITAQGKAILNNPEKIDKFINACFIICNGEFYEIFDDSEDDEVQPSKTAIKVHSTEMNQIIFDIEAEFIFNVDTKLTTKELLEWQDENDLFAFGLSVFINPEFFEDEIELPSVECFEDFSIAVVG